MQSGVLVFSKLCYYCIMRIEIDQSGKIEETGHNTVIAFSNSKTKSLLIKAKDKRLLQKLFREKGKRNIFTYKLFALLISVLLKEDLSKIGQVIIDLEYQAQDNLIKNFLLQYLYEIDKNFDKDIIHFQSIGRGSNAHKVALDVLRKDREPDIIVKIKDILSYLL